MPDMDIDQLWEAVSAGIGRYKDTARLLTELKPEQICPIMRSMAFSSIKKKSSPYPKNSAHMGRSHILTQNAFPRPGDAGGTARLGLRMGIISNTASLFQVFDTLEDITFARISKTLPCPASSAIVSRTRIFSVSRFGKLQVQPQTCVYVGDTLSATSSGLKMSVLA
jgi:hypothetical protein